MRLLPFTPREPIPDEKTTSQESKPDPLVIFEHDDVYARAGESVLGQLVSNSNHDEPSPPRLPEKTVEIDQMNAGFSKTPGIVREGS